MEKVTDYIQSVFVQNDDDQAEKILHSIKRDELPPISVSPETGKFMTMLLKSANCQNALEIGALGGYSGLHLLRGLKAGGQLTSLEINPVFALLAEKNLAEAGFKNVRYITGPALDSLKKLEQQSETFDAFFIDADKTNYTNYLNYAVKLGKPGALIMADNTLWSGKVYDEYNHEETTEALRQFNHSAARHPRLDSILLPIGDGLTIARIK